MIQRVVENRVYKFKGLGPVFEQGFLDFVHYLFRWSQPYLIPFKGLIVRAVNAVLPAPPLGLNVVAASDPLVRPHIDPSPQIRRPPLKRDESRRGEMKAAFLQEPHAWNGIRRLAHANAIQQFHKALFAVGNHDEVRGQGPEYLLGQQARAGAA